MTNGTIRRIGLLTRKSPTALLLLFAAGIAAVPAFAGGPVVPAGWTTIKDKTGVCQISIPPSWSTIPGSPGQFASPEHLASVLLPGFQRKPAPMTDADKHLRLPVKILENSAERWIYTTLPAPQKVITYHVSVPGSKRSCNAELTVNGGHSEDEIKKIAATLSLTNK